MTTGQRIAAKRKERNLSQEALGEQLGVSRQSIYKWEADASLPEIDKLVALSRLFGVPVGWLLGVEDIPEAAPGEFTEEQIKVIEEIFARYQPPAPAPADELTEEQRAQVEALVAEKLAAPPKKKRRRWPWVLAAAVALFLGWTAVRGWMDSLDNRINNLSYSVDSIQSSVHSQLSSVTGRVEEILQAQNSLLADYAANVSGSDLAKNTVTIAARATPKTYVDGLRVVFLADSGGGNVTEVPGTDDGNHRFSADITCPLTDSITVSVVLIDGDIRQTQLLESFVGLYNSSFPGVEVRDYQDLWGLKSDKDGLFHLEGGRSQIEVWLSGLSAAPVLPDGLEGLEVAEVRKVQAGLFKNRELIAWLEEDEEESAAAVSFWVFSVPKGGISFAAQEGDEIWSAALITDNYGRRRMALDIPPMVVRNGEIDMQGGTFDWQDYSYEPADWGL